MKSDAKLLLILAVLDALLAIGLVGLGSIACGIGEVNVLSKFYELYDSGVINQVELLKFQEGLLADDWAKTPYYIMGDSFKISMIFFYAAGYVLLGNSLALILICIKFRHKQESNGPTKSVCKKE